MIQENDVNNFLLLKRRLEERAIEIARLLWGIHLYGEGPISDPRIVFEDEPGRVLADWWHPRDNVTLSFPNSYLTMTDGTIREKEEKIKEAERAKRQRDQEEAEKRAQENQIKLEFKLKELLKKYPAIVALENKNAVA